MPHYVQECVDGTLTLEGNCPFSGKAWKLDGVSREAYLSWRGGVLIQDAFPDMSMDERELLMTGIVSDEWDEAFPDE